MHLLMLHTCARISRNNRIKCNSTGRHRHLTYASNCSLKFNIFSFVWKKSHLVCNLQRLTRYIFKTQWLFFAQHLEEKEKNVIWTVLKWSRQTLLFSIIYKTAGQLNIFMKILKIGPFVRMQKRRQEDSWRRSQIIFRTMMTQNEKKEENHLCV